MSEATKSPPVTEEDYKPFDVGSTKKPKLRRGEFDQERWNAIIAAAKKTHSPYC